MDRRIVAVVVAFLLLIPVTVFAQAQAEWLSPLPQGNHLLGVAYGDGRFVAVGEFGTVLVSADGEAWEMAPRSTRQHLTSIAFGAGRFVAASGGGDLLASEDGLTWTPQAAAGRPIARVIYGQEQFLALTADGSLALTSTDGLAWVTHETGLAVTVRDVTVGEGRFSAVVRDSADRVLLLTSPDGASWRDEGELALNPPWPAVLAVGNGVSVAAAGSDVVTTIPLLLRQKQELRGTFGYGSGEMTTALYADGRFLLYQAFLVSMMGGPTRNVAEARLLTSVDGLQWQAVPVTGGRAIRSIAYGHGRYVGVGDFGLTAAWQADTEGIELQQPGSQVGWDEHSQYGPVAGNGRSVRADFGGEVFSSADGRTWTERKLPQPLGALAFGRGQFWALSEDHLYTSVDGLTWQQRSAQGLPDQLIYSVKNTLLVGEEQLVMLVHQLICNPRYYGEAACVWTDIYASDDGLVWTLRRSGTYARAAVYAEGRFVAAGSKGNLYTSADGIHWERVDLLTGTDLHAVTYEDGRFLVAGESGTVLAVTFDQPEAGCATPFTDLDAAHTACPAIQELAARGVLRGYGDGTVGPDRAVTRAEFAKMAVLALGFSPETAAGVAFPDAAGHWAALDGYLQAAVKLGAINGFEDGTFRPDAPVTRAQAVKMALAMAGVAPATQQRYAYYDADPEEWHAPWIWAALELELVSRSSRTALWIDGRLGPDEPATRGELAILLENLRKAK